MALSRDEVERIQRMMRQLDLLRRSETEAGVTDIKRLYAQLARELRPVIDKLRDATDDTAFEAAMRELMSLVRKGTGDAGKKAHGIIERLIDQAATRGHQAPVVVAVAAAVPSASLPRVLELARAIERTQQRPGSFVNVSFTQPAKRTAAQIKRKVYQDGLNLSRRLHRRTVVQQAEFNRVLTEGIAQGRAAVKLAKDLNAIGGIHAEVPQYLDKVVQAARSGNTRAFEQALDKAWEIANKRKAGELGVRSITRQFLARMKHAQADRIDEFVSDYLGRKAGYHATVIARHETNEANRTAYREASKDKPWVLGLKWNLSASHVPSGCVCEELATQDLHKLGPGVYTVDTYPTESHPNCMCYETQVIDPDYFNDDVIDDIRELAGVA